VKIIAQSQPETKENMYLNMDKKRLCGMVADLNFITRSQTASAIERCAKDLKEYKESGLSMQKSDVMVIFNKDNGIFFKQQ